MEASISDYDPIRQGSNPWRFKIRALQLRIRDRFRVAVDRTRYRQRFSDSYSSSALQRWILRLRSLRRDSSVQSTLFYRKRVSKDVDAIQDTMIIRMLQRLAVPVIGNACHVFMHGLNCVQIYGAEKLHQALLQRPEGKPLITVSNHVASVDDPFVIASLLPPSVLLDVDSLRWTLCATDRCFKNPVTSAFFQSVKVLPVSRGDGIYQKGMDMALSKLNNGGWVHIFPEGSRSRDGGKTLGSAKRGVGSSSLNELLFATKGHHVELLSNCELLSWEFLSNLKPPEQLKMGRNSSYDQFALLSKQNHISW